MCLQVGCITLAGFAIYHLLRYDTFDQMLDILGAVLSTRARLPSHSELIHYSLIAISGVISLGTIVCGIIGAYQRKVGCVTAVSNNPI